jgi:hypothetical protein
MRRCCDCCELENPALARLCGDYLHADWPDEYRQVREAVEAFVRAHPTLAARLPGEVERLLSQVPAESELLDLLVTHLGCAFWPYGQGMSYARWLQATADQVTRSLRSRRQGSG